MICIYIFQDKDAKTHISHVTVLVWNERLRFTLEAGLSCRLNALTPSKTLAIQSQPDQSDHQTTLSKNVRCNHPSICTNPKISTHLDEYIVLGRKWTFKDHFWSPHRTCQRTHVEAWHIWLIKSDQVTASGHIFSGFNRMRLLAELSRSRTPLLARSADCNWYSSATVALPSIMFHWQNSTVCPS